MKQLTNFILIYLSLLLFGCEQQATTEQPELVSTNEMPVVNVLDSVEPVAAQRINPYYALRPVDDTWPTLSEGTEISLDLQAANYYIVLDGSGSMAGDNCAVGSTKMAVAKTAIKQFAQQIGNNANIALYSFDARGGNQRVALANNNREQVYSQINAIKSGGITPLASALQYGYLQLQAQAVKQLGYGEYHLVVVTDGIATANEIPDQVVQTILQESPVIIHSIGFCLDENHSLNQPGRTFYTAASNAEELQRGLQAVLAESTDFNSDTF